MKKSKVVALRVADERHRIYKFAGEHRLETGTGEGGRWWFVASQKQKE